MTKEERIEKGLKFHSEGYNCAQSVLMAEADRLGLTETQAAAVSGGFGGGVGGQGEICGVASALTIAESIMTGDDPKQKAAMYGRVRELCDKFREMSGGKLCCRDLKRPGQPISCDQLIANGIAILDEAITDRK